MVMEYIFKKPIMMISLIVYCILIVAKSCPIECQGICDAYVKQQIIWLKLLL